MSHELISGIAGIWIGMLLVLGVNLLARWYNNRNR